MTFDDTSGATATEKRITSIGWAARLGFRAAFGGMIQNLNRKTQPKRAAQPQPKDPDQQEIK
jgi:hypothetical protein